MDNLIDPKRYRAWRCRMARTRARLVTGRPMEVVEVRGPSVHSVDTAGVTVEYSPPRPAMG